LLQGWPAFAAPVSPHHPPQVPPGPRTPGSRRPGISPSTLTINGSYTQTAASTLNIQIGGLTAATQFDQLVVTGSATLSGTLNLTLLNSFDPSLGDVFRILTYGSRSGTFGTLNGLNLGSGRVYSPAYNATDLTLTVVSG
jgi:outer membrane autotransporter protein